MRTNEEIIQAFANHGLEIEFSEIGDGLHCEHNGLVLSCQWNRFNYCQNRSLRSQGYDWENPDPICSDFEMAIIDAKDDSFLPIGRGDSVLGWVPWECLDEILVAFKAGDWAGISLAAKEA